MNRIIKTSFWYKTLFSVKNLHKAPNGYYTEILETGGIDGK